MIMNLEMKRNVKTKIFSWWIGIKILSELDKGN